MRGFYRGILRYIGIMAVGGLVGVALAAWLGPGMVHWWATPGGSPPAFSCDPQVAWAMDRLIQIQLWLGLAAAVLFLLLGALILRSLKVRELRRAAATGAGLPAAHPGEHEPRGPEDRA